MNIVRYHILLLTIVAMIAAFMLWAAMAKIDIVSLAQGRVEPSSRVKKIQHLEGGIVRSLLVREGTAIKKGQPLIELEQIQSRSSVAELDIEINSLQADIIRLQAEAEGFREPEFPQELIQKIPDMVEESKRIFRARREKFNSEIAATQEIVAQKQQSIKEIEARIAKNKKALKLLQKQIAISNELLKDELTSEYKHLDLLRKEAHLKGELKEDGIALLKAKAALKQAENNLNKLRHQYEQKARSELKMAMQKMEELKQRRKKYSDAYQRTIIRSPVDGIVKRMYVSTIGEVVQPGKTILEIVPSDDRLVIEAHLHMQDVAYVRPGQTAIVKLASRDARRFGHLDARVENVSPDAFSTPDGHTFYLARVVTQRDYFEWEQQKYPLFPGMIVLVYIKTGERTVLEYLLDPYLERLTHAFTER